MIDPSVAADMQGIAAVVDKDKRAAPCKETSLRAEGAAATPGRP
jgi:hypothetical protein